MARAAAIFSLTFLLLGTGAAAGPPALAIVSRLGAVPVARIYNREEILFFARPAGQEGGKLLRGVAFVLYDEGGSPARSETVRVRREDEEQWGRPPSAFAFPVPEKPLPVGRYRLRAEKRGFRPAEIRIVVARFGYFHLETEHRKRRYRASFSLRLADPTEERRAVPVEVRVETADGNLLDSRSVLLAPVFLRPPLYESGERIRLSSSVARPDRERPLAARKGVLKVVPGSRLVLRLGRVSFTYPIPLPLEETKARDPSGPPAGSGRHLPGGR